MTVRHSLALFLVAACQPSAPSYTGFGSTPDITTAASTGAGSTSSSSSGTTGGESDSGGGGSETMAEPARDLGVMPDFGDGGPTGCRGKIDFLFVISRGPKMNLVQEQLAAAFPQFIATIESKFDDFDYHIMVVTGDDDWGNMACTEVCATPGCKVGEPCCGWYHQDAHGEPCCSEPDYPCEDLDLVTQCDRTWGAGEVFPAGVSGEANKPCPIDGGRRYLVKGQTDLEETFECIATVGNSGWISLGQGLVAAVQKPINDPGGCNAGFLRKDALLMVTLIGGPDESKPGSEGTPAGWAEAVIEAKHGDDKSMVMFNIGGPTECNSYDRVCQLVKLFPYHHLVHLSLDGYAQGFMAAADLVETACAGFTPPPG